MNKLIKKMLREALNIPKLRTPEDIKRTDKEKIMKKKIY